MVYRGISGGVLPESFLTPNEQGVRGGIEQMLHEIGRVGQLRLIRHEERRAHSRGRSYEKGVRRVRVGAAAAVPHAPPGLAT